MSAEAHPISPSRFSEAIQDLPVENLYSKAHELQNSISHLERSNAQLQEYSDSIKNDASLDEQVRIEGDKDCLDAIKENDIVIQRQQDRIDLLKREVERRGGRWHEADGKQKPATNGVTNGELDNSVPTIAPAPGGRLTDEELQRRLQEQIGDSDEDGVHL